MGIKYEGGKINSYIAVIFIIENIAIKVVHSIFLPPTNEMNGKEIDYFTRVLQELTKILSSEEIWEMGKILWKKK